MSKDKAKITVLKTQQDSRLYTVYQNRDENVEDFCKFENETWPSSLSQMGELRGGTKADLVKCLSDASSQTMEQLTVDAVILDGAVTVQTLQPTAVGAFEEYVNSIFAP